jgi:hypothetical protein
MNKFIVSVLAASIAVAGYGFTSSQAGAKSMSRYVRTVSPGNHQPIKATVLDDTPKHYTIDVKKFANLSADQEAPTFAVYVTNSLPKRCGDFRNLAIPYKKPEEYKRVFNLSNHPDVLTAIGKYGCVVMKNIPPAK